jgi:hypothetical protein
MSRLLVIVTPLVVALVLPVSAGQKQKEPEAPPPPPAHLVLRLELLKEQQTLYELQTQWFLQVLKVKRRAEKADSASARREAAACAKLIDATRDLPGLFDAAINRLKTDSLGNLAATKDVLKSTGQLADEMDRVYIAVKKDAQDTFVAGREVGRAEVQLVRSVLETAAKLRRAVDALDGMAEPGGNPSAAIKSAADLVTDSAWAHKRILEEAQQYLQKLKNHDAPAAQLAFYQEKLVGPLVALRDKRGGLIAAGEPMDSLRKEFPKVDPELLRKAQGQIRDNAQSLEEIAGSFVIVCRLPELAERQRMLHMRLKQYHDEAVNKLLDGLDK